jgi:predicted ATPase/DNA-binding CsgD family transcriptional regulator
MAVARAVGLAEEVRTPAIESLGNSLRDERLLLVVDNFEQVLDAAPILGDLLVACPFITILVTSRTLLRIPGEHPVNVPPLAIAAVDEMPPAVQLFAERAAGVVPGFILTSESVPLVGDICRRLDGLPLAIELAAARVNHLTLPDLRDRLDRRLALLTVSPRGVPDRHRTMRHAIAWSYDLLTPDQQRVFRALAVFAGGFTLEAVEVVAGDVPDVLLDLGTLVDSNLVRLEVSPQAGSRYTLLETVREFAVEQLAASGDEGARRRHAGYYLGLALRWYRTYWGDEPGDVRGLVRTEEANLRAAVSWALDQEDADMALQLALVMFDPLAHTGDNAREQHGWLRRGLALAGASPAVRCLALTRCASMVQLGRLDEGTMLAEEALALARKHNDAFGMAEALRVLGNIAIHTGDRSHARDTLLDALARFRTLGRRGRAGWTLHHLSALEGVGPEPDLALATAYCEEALAIFRDLGHVRGVESTLNWHAECACKLGDFPKALASAREGLVMTMNSSWSYDYFDCFADIAGQIGQAETAARLYGVADALREQARRPIEPAFLAEREHKMDVARQPLGESAFADAYAAGRTLTVEAAVAEALAVEMPPGKDAPQPADAASGLLTPRELEVMRLLAAGYSDRAIADTLFIGKRTVNTHVAHIYAKLGVNSRAAAVTAAVAAGLVDPASVDHDRT